MIEDKRNHFVKSDYGTNDFYRDFKKNNPEIEMTRGEYGLILNGFNSHLREKISSKGAGFILPCRIGRVELRKIKTEVKVDEDGNIVNNLPVNWKATREFWKNNPSAKEEKRTIKFTNEHTDGYTFKVSYLKSKALYKNKSVYKIRFNRELKRNLSRSIFKGRIDAFIK
tara:strand:- start:15049 stop:15555 length:507 start_codon:yes stop_codon:yes gene_type:complete